MTSASKSRKTRKKALYGVTIQYPIQAVSLSKWSRRPYISYGHPHPYVSEWPFPTDCSPASLLHLYPRTRAHPSWTGNRPLHTFISAVQRKI